MKLFYKYFNMFEIEKNCDGSVTSQFIIIATLLRYWGRKILALFSNRSDDRVMIFIDYRNIVDSTLGLSDDLSLDLIRLTHILTGSRSLTAAYVFDARPRFSLRKDDRAWLLHEELRDKGFRVVARDCLDYNRSEQKEVDVAMASEMIVHALKNHYDIAIVVSGDRDFVPAIQHIQASGKRVEVAAFENTLSEESRKVADIYYQLDKMPLLSLKSPSYAYEEV